METTMTEEKAMENGTGGKALVRAEGQKPAPYTFQETMTICKAFVQSGYFTDVRDVAQAMVKVLAGRELGLPPMASMQGIYIVKGKPSLSANLMAGAVKRSGKYNYRVAEHSEKVCRIKFFEKWDGQWSEVGESTFSLEDAKKAETQNLNRFPRNMLFARAMSNGVKWYCPDVFYGPTYTPDELGAEVNEAGEAVNLPTPPPAPEPTETGEVVGAAWVIQQRNLLSLTGFRDDAPAFRESLRKFTKNGVDTLEGVLLSDADRIEAWLKKSIESRTAKEPEAVQEEQEEEIEDADFIPDEEVEEAHDDEGPYGGLTDREVAAVLFEDEDAPEVPDSSPAVDAIRGKRK